MGEVVRYSIGYPCACDRGGAPEGTPELYFTDPDGLRIQLQDVAYLRRRRVPGRGVPIGG